MDRPGPLQASTSLSVTESSAPLHLALTWLAIKAWPLPGVSMQDVYSAVFTASIHEIISAEILEMNDSPISFTEMRTRTDGLVRREAACVSKLNAKLQARGQPVSEPRRMAAEYSSWMTEFADNFDSISDGCAFIDQVESEIRDRLDEGDEDDLVDPIRRPFGRHSLIGTFIRRLLLTLRKLSFDETRHLAQQVGQWCGATSGNGGSIGRFLLDRRLAMQNSLERRTQAMHEYRAASGCGDYTKALASLRRFYDYQPPLHSRGLHQHALLNLANFHYSTNGLEAAKGAIDEAIKIARGENDKACLQQCLSLSRRIDMESTANGYSALEGPRSADMPVPSGRLPEPQTPMDDLWAIKAAMDMGEPAHIAMHRVHRSLGRHQSSSGKHETKDTRDSWAAKHDFDLAAWHATQAGLWDIMGSGALVDFHEQMVMLRDADGRDSRLSVALARAARGARRGSRDEGLAILLDSTMFEGMTMAEYHRWARAVWATLEHGDGVKLTENQQAEEVLDSLRPSSGLSSRIGVGGNMREFSHAADPQARPDLLLVHDQVRDQLQKSRKLLDAGTVPHLVMPDLLSAVHLASTLSLRPLYRYGTVLLSLAMLEMEGAKLGAKARDQVLEIHDQILASDDAELVLLAEIVLGEAAAAIALDGNGDNTAAKAHLRSALDQARRLKARSLILRIMTNLTLLLDIDARTDEELEERDNMADMWRRDIEGDTAALASQTDEVRRVGRIVRLVGIRTAEGWR